MISPSIHHELQRGGVNHKEGIGTRDRGEKKKKILGGKSRPDLLGSLLGRQDQVAPGLKLVQLVGRKFM